MLVIHVAGARPNFMKVAPVMQAMSRHPDRFEQVLIHTGQHYDFNMSRVFFEELNLPDPAVNLEVGSGTHAEQTAQIMSRFEPVVQKYKPDLVLVPGDVNSTLACALVASKLGIRVGHVEAGLRSFDRSMPEEINRLVTDQLSDLLFTPSLDGNQNLAREGVAPEKVHFVGNVMIDSLVQLLPKADQRWPQLRDTLGLDKYVLVTLHRPANVDDPSNLRELLGALTEIAREIPVIFPVHPRTRQRIARERYSETLRMIDPVGYIDFLALQKHSAVILTDSGGIQEESTFLGVPCLTVRPNTERPVTITYGTNRLVKCEKGELVEAVRAHLNSASHRRTTAPPELWDGKTADRIVAVLNDSL